MSRKLQDFLKTKYKRKIGTGKNARYIYDEPKGKKEIKIDLKKDKLKIQELKQRQPIIMEQFKKYNKFGKMSPFERSMKNKYNRELDSIDKNINKLQYGINYIKKILKEFNISKVQTRTTGIRGYSPRAGSGYDLSLSHDGTIEFVGIDPKIQNEITFQINKIGLEISSTEGNYITLKKIIEN